jgi:predicted permease
MRMRRLSRWLRYLLPRHWRETVSADLEEEAAGSGHSHGWIAARTVETGLQLRSATIGEVLISDVRYAIRSLMRAPWFTGGAVLTLALGIGVTLAVFTVVDRILFRPLPVRDIRSLVLIGSGDAERGIAGFVFEKTLFIEIRRRVPAIEDLAFAGSTFQYRLSPDTANPSSLRLTQATYNVLDALGTLPFAGRGFSRDDVAASRPAAVVTYEAWQAKLGGEDVIGRRFGTGNGRFEIVGILPPGFLAPTVNMGSGSDGLFLRQDLLDTVAGPRDTAVASFARLRPGATMAQLRAQVDTVAARLDGEQPLARGRRSVGIEPFRSGMFGLVWPYFSLLSSAAALVWLMAAANLGGLLLARGRSREHVAALETAIGASRKRVMFAALTESVLVSAAGSAAALLLLWLCLSGLQALVPAYLQAFTIAEVDLRVAGAAMAGGVVASLVAGLVPAWRASRVDVLKILQRSGSTARAGRLRGGHTMLAVQAALGIVFVAGAAVMVRNFAGIVQADFGFEPRGLYEVRVSLSPELAEESRLRSLGAVYPRVLSVLRDQPGVTVVGATDTMPASGATMPRSVQAGDGTRIGVWQMADGFLDAIGARLLAGRDFDAADIRDGSAVVVITRNVVDRLWPGAEPAAAVGRTLEAEGERPRQVVGVIDNLLDSAGRLPEPRVYVPLGDPEFWQSSYAVRAAAPPDGSRIQAALGNAGVASVRVRAADSNIGPGLERPRLQAVLFASFAAIALILAAVGLYAITSLNVALRRAELGIRVAIGADAARLRQLVVADILRPVVAGSAAGLAVAYWVGRFAQAFIFQVDARDPWTLALVVAVLVATAVAAAWIPARRAARTDPAEVLRAQ